MRQKIGLVMAYYDNADMLKRHIGTWMMYPMEAKNRMQFVIVDDCSPSIDAATVIRSLWGSSRPLDLRVYRVLENKPWGQDGARNIGMKHVEALWSLMTDMDHLLPVPGVTRMMRFVDDLAERGQYYMPGRCMTDGRPYHSHPNSFLFHKEDFWKMGGYDEDFVGFYGSDGNFRKCARHAGLYETLISDTFKLVMYGMNDCPDARTRGLPRKEGPLWAVHNEKLNEKRLGPGYRAVNPFRLPYQRVI